MLSEIPQGSHQVASIWWTFTNLEDIEVSPYYWALDAGIVSWQAWQAPDGSFYTLELVALAWHTFAGALSPVASVPEPTNGVGPEVQAAFIHFTGTFTPGSKPTHGYIGNFNLGGTKADVLLAPNPQAGTGPYDAILDSYVNYPDSVFLQGVFSESYFYVPLAQEFCLTYDYVTGAEAYTGDIVT